MAATPAAQAALSRSGDDAGAARRPDSHRAVVRLHRAGAHDKALAAASAVPADSPFARRARFDVGVVAHRAEAIRRRVQGADCAPCRAPIRGDLECARRDADCAAARVTEPTRLPAVFFERATDRGAGQHRLPLQSRLRARAGRRHGGRAGLAARGRPSRRRRWRRAPGDERGAGRHRAHDRSRPRARAGAAARHVARDVAGRRRRRKCPPASSAIENRPRRRCRGSTR